MSSALRREFATYVAARAAPRGVLLGRHTTRYPSLVGLACRRRASPCDDRHPPGRRTYAPDSWRRALDALHSSAHQCRMEADHQLGDIAGDIAVAAGASDVRRDRLFYQPHLTLG
jgi:hypothetical protein